MRGCDLARLFPMSVRGIQKSALASFYLILNGRASNLPSKFFFARDRFVDRPFLPRGEILPQFRLLLRHDFSLLRLDSKSKCSVSA